MLSGFSSLLIVILAGTLSFAIPIPLEPGNVVVVRPKYFEPRGPGLGKVIRHPAVVVSGPDTNKIKVAIVSNNHPTNPPTGSPSDYGLTMTGTINLKPNVVDVKYVKVTNKYGSLSPEKLAQLKVDINKHCADGQTLTRRDGQVCKMRQEPAAKSVTNKNAPAAHGAGAKKV